MEGKSKARGEERGEKWQKPTTERIKIDVDAKLGARVKKVFYKTEVAAAEVMSISFGLQVALLRGWQNIKIESYYLQVINWL